MQKHLWIKRMISHNEKTGESVFVGSDDTTYRGVSQFLPAKCPVVINIKSTEADGSILFTKLRCEGYNDEVSVAFLASDYFYGTGRVTAEAFIKKFGANIFSAEAGDKDITDSAIINKLQFLKRFEDVQDYILAKNGTFLQAKLAYLKFGFNTLEEISANPYNLFRYDGIPEFCVCEKIAKERGLRAFDKRRLKTLVGLALRYNRENGNTRVEYHKLLEMISCIEKKAGVYHTDSIFVMETLIENRAVIEKTGTSCHVYLKADYINEMHISSAIKRLNTAKIALQNELLPISELEKKYKISYSRDQKEAFRVIEQTGVKVITGGPGTGKTTFLNGVLEKYHANNPNGEIVLCAPTGCAARRMRQATGRPAVTIHKLLSIKPYESKDDNSVTRLTADCIVVDEVSMVDAALMARLLSAVKNSALILLLGDPDQLPSVSAGNVLHDLIESDSIEVYRLTTIFRQLRDNAIVINSHSVINGSKSLKSDDNFRIYRVSNEKALIDAALRLINRNPKINTYTSARKTKFASGTISLNHAIQKQRVTDGISVEYGAYRFYTGDRVMFVRNNYSMNYYNGEEGVISRITKNFGQSRVTVETEDGAITLSGELLNDIELSYAITAHKSQGSECDDALILIPKEPKCMLKRQLLYVEITRAKKNVVVISEGNALEECIDNNAEERRDTGLIEKLKKPA